MDISVGQLLAALLAREGLEAKPGDLEQFARIFELYLGTLETLHAADLGAEEPAPVFHPERVVA